MGARLVQDINPSGSSSPNELISLNGLLFFSAELGQEPDNENINNGTENTDSGSPESTNGSSTNNAVGLMRSDGSEGGTTVLRSFDSVSNLVKTKDQLFFIAGIGDQFQLWTSNGTTRGTKRVKDLYPNADLRFPQDLFVIDGVLFYSAIDNNDDIQNSGADGIGKYPFVNGYEVWRREGDGVGSLFFRNLIPDKIITDIQVSDGEGGSLILDSSGEPVQLKKTTTVEITIGASDTTTKTTIEEETLINGQVVNTITSNSQTRPTAVTDVASKTVDEEVILATEINNTAAITTTVFENDSFPRDFIGLNGNYFFTAQSSNFYSLATRTSDVLIGGLELWFSDGTEAGTRPININQNNYTFYEPEDGEYTPSSQILETDFGFIEQSSSSFPRELTPAKNNLYFVANDGINGFELWSISDKGENLSLISDLQKGSSSSSPEDLTVIGKRLYFSADNGSGRKLFYYQPSFKKPKIVKKSGSNPKDLKAIGNTLYYSAESELGRELWSAKKAKAKLIKDINPGSESSSPENMTIIRRINGTKTKQRPKNILYFTANDGVHGVELMSLDLKSKQNKVRIDSDVFNGPPSSFPRELSIHNQQLFFTAKTPSNGRELWTVGPAIQGPSGAAGASTTEISIFENKNFVYTFKTDESQDENWKINGGADASLFKINSNNGKLSFKSAPKHNKPADKNLDNIYEVYVRSITEETGYKADQLVNIKVIDSGSNIVDGSNNSEILYYTAGCGPITAAGPLYPCS